MLASKARERHVSPNAGQQNTRASCVVRSTGGIHTGHLIEREEGHPYRALNREEGVASIPGINKEGRGTSIPGT